MPNSTRKITVLSLNFPPEPTGIAPYAGAIARGLSEKGFEVRVATAHPHYPAWRIADGYGGWIRKERAFGALVTRLRHYVPRRPTGVRRLLSELSFGVRLVFAHWRRPQAVVAISPALFASAMAAVRMGVVHRRVPLIVWVQDLYWLGLAETGQDTGRAGIVIKRIERWLLRRADRVVVIHDRFARRVIDDFGVDPNRITVVRNWTHLPPAPEIDRVRARAARGWGDDTVILHAGNMGLKQGLDNVLDAAQLAADRGSNVRFVLLGNGAEHARLVEKGAGIANLQFIDPLPDAEFAQALAAADILLVNETVGVAEMAVPSKLTSYFSTGRPVLAATDLRGITADEVRAAEAGIVVAAGDPEQLLDAAIALGADPDLSTQLGENGKRYRETVLDETFAIDRFATMLSLLIEGADATKS